MHIHSIFPNTAKEPFIITSPPTPFYNCIAWAYGDDSKWFWPDSSNSYYWPEHIPRSEKVENFIQLFSTINYEVCENGDLEEGYEKVAIFSKNGVPTHAARQLLNGIWTSKLGKEFDVSHSIFSIINGVYGEVSVFMKRILT
jgi:hypothetical protein